MRGLTGLSHPKRPIAVLLPARAGQHLNDSPVRVATHETRQVARGAGENAKASASPGRFMTACPPEGSNGSASPR